MKIILKHKYKFKIEFPTYEPKTTKWVLNNVKEDWVCFDCGANIGYYSIMFSKLTTNGVVHSFEPTQTMNLLQKNCQENGCENILFHNVAIGNKTGIQREPIYRIWGQKAEVMDYNFSTLDDFCKTNKIKKIDLIKIDVDSFEYEVVEGSEETLKKYSPLLLVELNKQALALRNRRPVEVTNLLGRLNYTPIVTMDENVLYKKNEN
jgi:FkbM family methyltransferase